MKKFVQFTLAAITGSLLTFGLYNLFGFNTNQVILKESSYDQKARFTASGMDKTEMAPFDFTYAAANATPAVVHIKSTQVKDVRGSKPQFDPFFGPDIEDFFHRNNPRGPHKAQSSGSGVIISNNGYIVTNNHVVEGANLIEVIMSDKRTYKAKLVGTDPSTDLALLQIKEKNLPHIIFGNSDDIKIGEWVLAVGNPFNLESTATAGIVSAKARNINILRNSWAVESFIQTDAAVNPGNSGGALVNPRGELIGINTAIATPTGTYAGYSFAVPANMVKKITEDLIQYGSVQRGFLGIMIRSLDGEFARKIGVNLTEGVYVDSTFENSAARQGGLKKGDIITAIDGEEVKASPELQEKIARKRPGENVEVTYIRDGKTSTTMLELKNKDGNTKIVAKEEKSIMDKLGLEVSELTEEEKKDAQISNGVKVNKIENGLVSQFTDMREGYIITNINGKRIESEEDVIKILSDHRGGVMIEGVYPDYPGSYYYAFGIE